MRIIFSNVSKTCRLEWRYGFFFHLYLKAEKAQQREKNLEEAKKITIKEDETLPKAKRVSIRYMKNTTRYKKLVYSDRQFSKSLFHLECFVEHWY